MKNTRPSDPPFYPLFFLVLAIFRRILHAASIRGGSEKMSHYKGYLPFFLLFISLLFLGCIDYDNICISIWSLLKFVTPTSTSPFLSQLSFAGPYQYTSIPFFFLHFYPTMVLMKEGKKQPSPPWGYCLSHAKRKLCVRIKSKLLRLRCAQPSNVNYPHRRPFKMVR